MVKNRIAIVDIEKCKPTKCKRECISFCPPQSGGMEVVKIVDIEDIGAPKPKPTDKKSIAKIVESMCIGCNICVKKCPYNAINIVNIPYENKADIIHRYGTNGFRLYKLPILKKNSVIGFVGPNGVGKTTLTSILSGQIIPNFESGEIPDVKKIPGKFRGSVLFDYLKDLFGGKLTVAIKPQKVKISNGEISVEKFIGNKITNHVKTQLELEHLMDKPIGTLSGGELQRVLCGQVLCANANVYVFDEPSNYLDIKQRLAVTKLIRELSSASNYVMVIEHDLSMLDYMADEIFILYGQPGAYGIVSKPLTPLDGLNMFLDGYIPSENIRFRPNEFNLKTVQEVDSNVLLNFKTSNYLEYSGSTINYPGFKLTIPDGKINLESINVILGANGNGKTTFIKYLSKTLGMSVSIKEQTLSIDQYKNNSSYPTVNELLYGQIQIKFTDSVFISEVVKPLEIEEIRERRLDELSGGELQRVLIILCLGKEAPIYLIDEPSANLDIEKRLSVIKVIKRFLINNHKCGFIIEHDIMMAVSFAQEANSNIILIGKSHLDETKLCTVSEPVGFTDGINSFLQTLNITMRTSGHNRPRINKPNSQLDKEQREANKYYM